MLDCCGYLLRCFNLETPMVTSTQPSSPEGPDANLAIRVAKLWPHRKHESNWLKGFFCALGGHRWRSLNLAELLSPGQFATHKHGGGKSVSRSISEKQWPRWQIGRAHV